MQNIQINKHSIRKEEGRILFWSNFLPRLIFYCRATFIHFLCLYVVLGWTLCCLPLHWVPSHRQLQEIEAYEARLNDAWKHEETSRRPGRETIQRWAIVPNPNQMRINWFRFPGGGTNPTQTAYLFCFWLWICLCTTSDTFSFFLPFVPSLPPYLLALWPLLGAWPVCALSQKSFAGKKERRWSQVLTIFFFSLTVSNQLKGGKCKANALTIILVVWLRCLFIVVAVGFGISIASVASWVVDREPWVRKTRTTGKGAQEKEKKQKHAKVTEAITLT